METIESFSHTRGDYLHHDRIPFFGRSGVRFAFMFLLILLPLVVLDAFEIYRQRQTGILKAKTELHTLAAHIAHEHEALIGSARDVLLALGRIDDVRGNDHEACSEVMSRVAAKFDRYTVFSKVDTNGYIVCSSTPLESKIDVSSALNIQNAFKTKQFSLSRFMIGPVSKKPVLIFSNPITGREGDLIGLVNTGLNLDWLQEYVEALKLPDAATLLVFDSQGTLFAAYPQGETPVGSSVIDRPPVQEVLRTRDGTALISLPSGAELLTGFSEVEEIPGGLFIALYQPEHAALAEITQSFRHRFMVHGLAFISAILLAWIASRKLILNWIDQLSVQARHLARGDFTQHSRIGHKRSDLGRLAQSFDTMAQKLLEREKELLHLQIHMQLALSGTNDGVWDWDIPAGTVMYSQRWKEMLGYSGIQISNSLNIWKQSIHPADFDDVYAKVQAHLNGETPQYESIHRMQRRDGSFFWILDRGRAVRNGRGEPYRMVGALTDISDRIELQENMRALINASMDAVMLLEPDGTVVTVNQLVAERFHRTIDEMVGENIFRLMPPETARRRREKIKEVVEDKAPVAFEDTRNGLFLHNTVYPVFDEAGRVDRLAVYSQDITQRKQAEEALRYQNLLLYVQQETSPEGILVIDQNLSVRSWNSRFAAMWSIPLEIMESNDGHLILDTVCEQLMDPQTFIERIQYLYDNLSEIEEGTEVHLKNGRTYERHSKGLIDDSGIYWGRVWFFRDISERKQYERALHDSNEELRGKQHRIDEDLFAAAGIQRSLLPQDKMDIHGLDISWIFRPSEHIGGDIFNIFPVENGRKVVFYMIDVAGHGVPSALVSVSLSQALGRQSGSVVVNTKAEALEPAAVLEILDYEYPVERFDKHFTMFYGSLDVSTGRLLYSNGGHPYAILLTTDGDVKILDHGGTLMGLGGVLPFEQGEELLHTGDIIILYTDGIIEHETTEGHVFGEERLIRILLESSLLPIEDILGAVHSELIAFSPNAPLLDDVSILGFTYMGPSEIKGDDEESP